MAKVIGILLACLVAVHSDPAPLCQPWICKAPECRCASTNPGVSFPKEQIPQLVMLTFDDAVTALITDQVSGIIDNLKNPDGCEVQATFYVSHEYTDYHRVHELWAKGHEIALHSISHSPYITYWRNITEEQMLKEFSDQRDMMAHFAKINKDDIKGMRVPLFQLSGDISYKVMLEAGLEYDSSWPTSMYNNPGLWPYTLDYFSTQDCSLGSCPESSIPGAWVQPILAWQDETGMPCAMVDACVNVPDHDVDLLTEWMKGNFHRIYNSNRAPFGVHLHAAWLSKGPNYIQAFKKFLEYLVSHDDVFLVQTKKVIEYAKNPVPLEEFESCSRIYRPSCTPRSCQLLKRNGSSMEERWMMSCAACPVEYPWVDNPLGARVD